MPVWDGMISGGIRNGHQPGKYSARLLATLALHARFLARLKYAGLRNDVIQKNQTAG
jgi:hypothetical protein